MSNLTENYFTSGIVFLPMLTDEQLRDLKTAHKQTRDKRLADRIKAVIMLHNGFTFEQIKQALLLDEVTIRRYSRQFQKKGIDGPLHRRKNTPNP